MQRQWSFVVAFLASELNVHSVVPLCILRLPSSAGEKPVNTKVCERVTFQFFVYTCVRLLKTKQKESRKWKNALIAVVNISKELHKQRSECLVER